MFKYLIAVTTALLLWTASTPTPAADEANDGCVTPSEVLTYFLSEPNAWSDMHPIGSMKAVDAQTFLKQLRFPGDVSKVAVMIAFESKANRPGDVFIVSFDADGCGINTSGERATKEPGDGVNDAPAGAWISKQLWIRVTIGGAASLGLDI